MFKKILFVLFLLLLPLSVLAAEYHSNENILIPKDKEVNTNYYAVGNNIEIYGDITGDIFLAGNSITIGSENINGDLFIIGQNITVRGVVNGDLRVVTIELNIEGEVNGNVLNVGQNMYLLQDASINGNFTNYLSKVSLWGNLNGKVDGFFESLLLSGLVKEDIDINFIKRFQSENQLNISEDAEINNIKYIALEKGTIDENANILGEVSYTKDEFIKKPIFTLDNILSLVVKLFSLLIIGMIMIYLWPSFFSSAYSKGKEKRVKKVFKGLLLFIVTPLVSILLLFTVIGIPLGVLLLLLYGMFIYLTNIIVAYFYGKYINDKLLGKRKISTINILALGIFLLIVVLHIPIFGIILQVLTSLLIWGVILEYIFNKLKSE